MKKLEKVKSISVLVGSDSVSTLTLSITYMQSDRRHDIVLDIAQMIFRIKRAGIEVKFIWIPTYRCTIKSEIRKEMS